MKGLTKAFSCHIFAGGKHNRKHKAYGLQKDCMHRRKTVERKTYGRKGEGRAPRCYAANRHHCTHNPNRRDRSRNRHAEPHIRPAARGKRPQDGGSKGYSKRNAFPKSCRPRVSPRWLPRRTIRVPFQRAHRSHGVPLPV